MNKEKQQKVIDLLKEINEILRETNVEMAKALKLDKNIATKYVIYSQEYGGYVPGKNASYLANSKSAYLFNSKEEALEELDTYDADLDMVIKEIKCVEVDYE